MTWNFKTAFRDFKRGKEIAVVLFNQGLGYYVNELKLKISEVLSFFEKEPMASASIGQVHKAQLLNGKTVVVKVQRPNIKPIIESDIDILYYLAGLAK